MGRDLSSAAASQADFGPIPGSLDAFYEKIRVVGNGTFGKAWLVRRRQELQQQQQPSVSFASSRAPGGNNSTEPEPLEFVMKAIPTDLGPEAQADADREASLHSRLVHEHIVRFVEQAVAPGVVHIVMEYSPGGDLASLLHRRSVARKPFAETHAMTWFTQIVQAVAYIHARGLVHRDVKSANVFIHGDGTIRLGDMGCARELVADGSRTGAAGGRCSTPCGTPMYQSPEQCRGEEYGSKVDIWALGCVLYEMCALRPAYNAPTLDELGRRIKQATPPPLPTSYSKDVARLVSSMMALAPEDRPTCSTLLVDSVVVPYIGMRADAYGRPVRTAVPLPSPAAAAAGAGVGLGRSFRVNSSGLSGNSSDFGIGGGGGGGLGLLGGGVHVAFAGNAAAPVRAIRTLAPRRSGTFLIDTVAQQQQSSPSRSHRHHPRPLQMTMPAAGSREHQHALARYKSLDAMETVAPSTYDVHGVGGGGRRWSSRAAQTVMTGAAAAHSQSHAIPNGYPAAAGGRPRHDFGGGGGGGAAANAPAAAGVAGAGESGVHQRQQQRPQRAPKLKAWKAIKTGSGSGGSGGSGVAGGGSDGRATNMKPISHGSGTGRASSDPWSSTAAASVRPAASRRRVRLLRNPKEAKRKGAGGGELGPLAAVLEE